MSETNRTRIHPETKARIILPNCRAALDDIRPDVSPEETIVERADRQAGRSLGDGENRTSRLRAVELTATNRLRFGRPVGPKQMTGVRIDGERARFPRRRAKNRTDAGAVRPDDVDAVLVFVREVELRRDGIDGQVVDGVGVEEPTTIRAVEMRRVDVRRRVERFQPEDGFAFRVQFQRSNDDGGSDSRREKRIGTGVLREYVRLFRRAVQRAEFRVTKQRTVDVEQSRRRIWEEGREIFRY